ncbi:MAG: flagellar hook assembly protein FlgD [Alphaproteobacteria bacterium]
MEVNASTAASQAQAGSTTKSLSGLADNFDNFLTILTTQLQHQDPLSPLDSNEFTSQLVQFTGVEQQVLQNKNLEQLIALQGTNQQLGAVSFLGKVVEAVGNTNMLTDGEATFSYILPQAAKTAVIQVFNNSGDLVFQEPVDKDAGLHDYEWDGSTTNGGTAPEGIYRFAVTALDDAEEPIAVVHRVLGLVTGVSIENGETVLGIGDVGVPLDSVTGIQTAPDKSNTEEQS